MPVSPMIRFGKDPYKFETSRLTITEAPDDPAGQNISLTQFVDLTGGVMDLFNRCGDENLKDADKPQPVKVAGLQIELGGSGEKKLTAKDVRDGKLTGVWHIVRRSFTAVLEATKIFIKKAYHMIMSAESKVEKLGQVFSSLFGGVGGGSTDAAPKTEDKKKDE